MSYETSSEFQIRYLLKSVAVYLLFMRRIASISMLAVVSALSASAATVLFDFNSSLLPETPAKTVSVTDSGSGFVATLATASSSANLGSASSVWWLVLPTRLPLLPGVRLRGPVPGIPW